MTSSSPIAFIHGVASGDPYKDSIIIWTRINPFTVTGSSAPVTWEVSTSKDFLAANIVKKGSFQTSADRDWTVKAEVEGLNPGTQYFYRFTSGNSTSEIGASKTLAVNAQNIHLGIFSCANFTAANEFLAYGRAADINTSNPYDAFIHLGDYIYEYGKGGYSSAEDSANTRGFLPDKEIVSLDDYRQRYAQYHTDPSLKKLRASAPLIAIWDDHETANDSYDNGAENHQVTTEGTWNSRRDAALKAYYEWMPIREPLLRDGTDTGTSTTPLTKGYRSFDFADVLSLHILETRLTARDKQLSYPTAVEVQARIGQILSNPNEVASYSSKYKVSPPTSPSDAARFGGAIASAVTNELVANTVLQAYTSNREMLGSEQLSWLENEIKTSTAAWQILGSGTLMQNMAIPAELLLNASDPKVLAKYATPLQKLALGQALTTEESALFNEAGKIPYNLDAWDGYGSEREKILESALKQNKKIVNLAGDTHNGWAGILDTSSGKLAGVEFATPGVTSPGLEKYFPGVKGLGDLFEAYVKDLTYANAQDRGFLDLNLNKNNIIAGFEYLKAMDPYTKQPVWESDILTSTGYDVITKSKFSSEDNISMNNLSTIRLNESGAEISAYHTNSKLIFSIGGSDKLSVVDISNPFAPVLKEIIPLSGIGNSVAVSSTGLVAVAVEGFGADRYVNGRVNFFNVTGSEANATISLVGSVVVGTVPDSIAFSPDGSKLIVANEGEPNELYTIDPEGSISIVSVNTTNPASSTVTNIGFSNYNGREAELRALGIRISGKTGTTASQDLEPEYVSVSADGSKAYVTFQENNAMGVISLTGTGSPSLLSLRSLGVQDYLRGIVNIKNYDLTIASPGTTSAGAIVPGGGLSGLYATGKDSEGRLTLICPSDRGPNGTGASKDVIKADGTAGTDGILDTVQPFLLPDYQARFYKLAVDEKTGIVSTTAEVKLTQKDGITPITGRSNGKTDQIPVDANGNLLPYDPYGADLESIVQDKDGNIWMSDEYRPAIYKFNPTGKLIERYVPLGAGVAAGLTAGALGVETLPSEYAKRQLNRGFEGMAYDSTIGKLWAFVQSPLAVTNSTDAKKSSLIRILEIDAVTGNPTAEYLYPMWGKDTVAPDGALYENKVDKIGDVAYDSTKQVFYVLERDSAPGALSYKQVFEVSLKGATNILGNSVANEENLSIDSLSAQGIKLPSKVLLTNLASEGYIPNDKPEGLALLSDGRLAVINDNDFGVTALDAAGYTALTDAEKAKYKLASDINGSKTYVWANASDAKIQLGIIDFEPVGIDPSDRDNQIKLNTAQNLYGLRMPDGIAAFQAKGLDGTTQTFTVFANEGDTRVRPDGDYTSNGVTTKDGSVYIDEVRTGITGVSPDNRLKTIKDLGNYDASTPAYEQRFAFGARSITIADSLGNIVWDSGDLLDRAAITAGVYDDTRSDDKGTEPENITVASIAGKTYAFVGLERTTTSSIAAFDITNPYAAYLIDFQKSASGIISPEGLIVIPAAQSPNGKDLLVVSNEVSKDLEILTITPGSNHSRFYDPITNMHMYTASPKEAAELLRTGWKSEGDAWNLLQAAGGETGGLAEVHRLYNPTLKDHLFTLNDAEVTNARNLGYVYEGVAGRALPVPATGGSGYGVVQRFYNPAKGEHFYTASSSEAATLPGLGFVSEGAAWMF